MKRRRATPPPLTFDKPIVPIRQKPSTCSHTTDTRFALITTNNNGIICVACGQEWSPNAGPEPFDR